MSNKQYFSRGFKQDVPQKSHADKRYNFWDVVDWKIQKYQKHILLFQRDIQPWDVAYLTVAALIYPGQMTNIGIPPGKRGEQFWDITDERVIRVLELRFGATAGKNGYNYDHMELYMIAWMAGVIKILNTAGMEDTVTLNHSRYTDEFVKYWLEVLPKNKEFTQNVPEKFQTVFYNEQAVAGLMGNMRAESHICPFRWQRNKNNGDVYWLDSVPHLVVPALSKMHNGEYGIPRQNMGLGLIQWTNERLYDLLFHQPNYFACGVSMKSQLNFFVHELSTKWAGGKKFGPNNEIPAGEGCKGPFWNLVIAAARAWQNFPQYYDSTAGLYTLAWFDAMITGQNLDGSYNKRMAIANRIDKNMQTGAALSQNLEVVSSRQGSN